MEVAAVLDELEQPERRHILHDRRVRWAGRCRLTASKPVLKVPIVSALEATI